MHQSGTPEFLYNGIFYYRSYISVESGQYLKFGGCKLYKIADYPAVNKNADSWHAGQYKGGVDLDAGDYLLITNKQDEAALSSGFYEVTTKADAKVTSAEYLYNDNFYYRSYITVVDGQYLKFNGCKLYKVDKYPAVNKNADSWHSGQYKVGVDLDAGQYKLTTLANESILDWGYVEITKTPNAKVGTVDFVSNDNFENQKYITLTEGTYIKFNRAVLTKVSE